MDILNLTRRSMILGAAASLGGCGALSSINAAATPLDTYDLTPVPGATSGARSRRTLLVARPAIPAASATDRIMIKPTPASITYLRDARWPDELPAFLQSLLIRSIAGTGRLGYVGDAEGGPVPDLALLTRVDAFHIEVQADLFMVRISMNLTMMRDRDQRVLASRSFDTTTQSADDQPANIVSAFQAGLNDLLPDIANWVAGS